MAIAAAPAALVARYAGMAVHSLKSTDKTVGVQPLGPERDSSSRERNAPQSRSAGNPKEDRVSFSPEAEKIRELQQRDREVRVHEQAHAAVGGAYSGQPTFTLERGPDGRSYAVSGEVSIDTTPVANDPEATLQKAETIYRAAMAPTEPSSADRAIAAKAGKMAAEARREISEKNIGDIIGQPENGSLSTGFPSKSTDTSISGTRLSVMA